MLRAIPVYMAIFALLAQGAMAQSTVRGRAVCIGLNEVDPGHYGSPLKLGGCRNDAQDLATILRSIAGFAEPKLMLDGEAKVAAVTSAIESAANDLNGGDIFVLTIASHGSQLPDLNNDEAELDSSDRLDETWLLYDRMWVDDERYPLWKKFKPGVRIVIVADTCHSGTTFRNPFSGTGSVQEVMNGVLLKSEAKAALPRGDQAAEAVVRGSESLRSDAAFYNALLSARSRAAAFPLKARGEDVRGRGLGRDIGISTRAVAELSQSVRSIDRQDALALYAARSDVYDPILKLAPISERSTVGASVILLAACQDFQTAADGDLNGAFTGALKEEWNDGFVGTYEEFLNKVKGRLYNRYFDQIPNYLTLGAPSDPFQNKPQRPFSVEP